MAAKPVPAAVTVVVPMAAVSAVANRDLLDLRQVLDCVQKPRAGHGSGPRVGGTEQAEAQGQKHRDENCTHLYLLCCSSPGKERHHRGRIRNGSCLSCSSLVHPGLARYPFDMGK